ncbi:hypothetical protein BDZ89DRAFT_1062727, partial [Hymenopellis radicata]
MALRPGGVVDASSLKRCSRKTVMQRDGSDQEKWNAVVSFVPCSLDCHSSCLLPNFT